MWMGAAQVRNAKRPRLGSAFRSARAQATVELALALPILLLLVFGIVEFGRIYGNYTVLQSAAREGVRIAATGGDDSSVRSRVNDAAIGLDTASLQVDIKRDTVARLVTVKLGYPVQLLTGWIGDIVGHTVQLQASAVMAYDIGP